MLHVGFAFATTIFIFSMLSISMEEGLKNNCLATLSMWAGKEQKQAALVSCISCPQ